MLILVQMWILFEIGVPWISHNIWVKQCTSPVHSRQLHLLWLVFGASTACVELQTVSWFYATQQGILEFFLIQWDRKPLCKQLGHPWCVCTCYCEKKNFCHPLSENWSKQNSELHVQSSRVAQTKNISARLCIWMTSWFQKQLPLSCVHFHLDIVQQASAKTDRERLISVPLCHASACLQQVEDGLAYEIFWWWFVLGFCQVCSKTGCKLCLSLLWLNAFIDTLFTGSAFPRIEKEPFHLGSSQLFCL